MNSLTLINHTHTRSKLLSLRKHMTNGLRPTLKTHRRHHPPHINHRSNQTHILTGRSILSNRTTQLMTTSNLLSLNASLTRTLIRQLIYLHIGTTMYPHTNGQTTHLSSTPTHIYRTQICTRSSRTHSPHPPQRPGVNSDLTQHTKHRTRSTRQENAILTHNHDH